MVMDDSTDLLPIGMRVLAVDDDPTCLKVLETLLRRCEYHVTTTSQAIMALNMLRENKDKFDLVISDVHIPDMDGFKLLELVGLEMDLPVIMLSAYGDTKLAMKGISHGACDYLLKPVRLEELKNIWQHVIRKKKSDSKGKNKTNKPDNATSDSCSGLRSAGTENSDENGRLAKKRKDQDEDEDEVKENGNDNEDPSAQKKPRVVWSVELHRKFVAAVNHLGIDKAVPKKILDMMNVENITRENVASHLQKYRLYLKRISCVANQQASMVAALGSADQSYLRMGGPGHFHSNAFRSFLASGIISNLNSPAGLNGHGFSPSGLLQLGQSQSLNNSSGDQFKFQSAITLVNQNILQGMPMSIGYDHLQNSKGTISLQNMNTDVKPTFPIPSQFTDQRPRVTTSSFHPPSLGISNNTLMSETRPEGKRVCWTKVGELIIGQVPCSYPGSRQILFLQVNALNKHLFLLQLSIHPPRLPFFPHLTPFILSPTSPKPPQCFVSIRCLPMSCGDVLCISHQTSTTNNHSRSLSSASASPGLILVDSAEEFDKIRSKVQDDSSHAIFYFTAVWCGPCRFISPIVGELSKKYPNVATYKIDN